MYHSVAWKVAVLSCLCLALVGLGGAAPLASSASAPTVTAFGEPLTFGPDPLIIADRVYVAAETLTKALGLQLDWDSDRQTVYVNSTRANLSSPAGTVSGYPAVNLLVADELQSASPAVLVGETVYLPLRAVRALGISVGWNAGLRTAYIGCASKLQLPKVGSMENLRRLLSNTSANNRYGLTVDGLFKGMDSQAASESDGATAPTASSDYSTTNTQVQGVDEADIVKTDGKYIYQAKGQTVLISQAYPANQLQVVSTIDLSSHGSMASELFVTGDHLLVIGQHSAPYGQFMPLREPELQPSDAEPARGLMPRYYRQQATDLFVYNIEDPSAPKLVRTVELEGSYLTARLVDSRLILLANQSIYGEPIAPSWRDSVVGQELQSLSIPDISYFPERPSNSYLLLADCDIAQDDAPALVSAYLGAGENVYMSKSNLYVSTNQWWNNQASIYRFSLEQSKLAFQAKGSVPGQLLNQFSMDEWDEHLRVATTYDQAGQTQSGVYILDRQLNLTGQLDGLASGERIYSARFQAERGYLVTFEQVDPLFVLDLADAAEPKLLGTLKIPGFSTYLHPIDTEHLLGIGQDTSVMEEKDWTGKVLATRVLQQGLKLAIFDISDLAHPREEFSAKLGGRGSYSEALYNHKAVLYLEPEQLLALPVRLTATTADAMAYGQVEFQGAVVYRLSLEDGFHELGRISHCSALDLEKSGYYGIDNTLEVRRVLYIAGHLYTVSDSEITATNLESMTKVLSIPLP